MKDQRTQLPMNCYHCNFSRSRRSGYVCIHSKSPFGHKVRKTQKACQFWEAWMLSAEICRCSACEKFLASEKGITS